LDAKLTTSEHRKLTHAQLDALLDALYAFFYALEPPRLRATDAREALVRCRSTLPALVPAAAKADSPLHGFGGMDFDGDAGLSAEDRAKVAGAAGALAEWLVGWLECVLSPLPVSPTPHVLTPRRRCRERLQGLDDLPLAEVWFTGEQGAPSEVCIRVLPICPFRYHGAELTTTICAAAEPGAPRSDSPRAAAPARRRARARGALRPLCLFYRRHQRPRPRHAEARHSEDVLQPSKACRSQREAACQRHTPCRPAPTPRDGRRH
jgi:hypothetical protein